MYNAGGQSLHNMTVMAASEALLLRQQLHQLKLQQQHLAHLLQLHSQHTLAIASQHLQQMAERVMDEIRERKRCEVEVEKSKAIQNSMKNEVIQLKEMINAAMIDYSQDLNHKEQEIKRLTDLLSTSNRGQPEPEQEEIRIEESRQSQQRVEELEIIQEVSEHCTYSSAAATLRELSREEDRQVDSSEEDPSEDSEAARARNALSQISQVIEAESQMVSKDDKPEPFLARTLEQTAARRYKTEYREQPEPPMNFDFDKENSETKQGHRRTKSFIDHFRKTLEQSLLDKGQDAIPINPVCFTKKAVPLQQLSQNQVVLPMQCHSQSFKPQSQKEACHPKTVYMNSENSSKASSIVNEINLNDTDTVFVPKKIETPKNMMFKKKDSSKRVMTEPSQQSRNYPYYTFEKEDPRRAPSSHSKHSLSRKNLIRDRPGSQDERRSIRRSTSKEKIKVTVKMFEESQPKKSSKGLVHLGGKGVFRKFLLELKVAFRQFTIKLGGQADEVKYEGQSRNGERWGRGRLYYRDGCVYEGEFRQNFRHGKGSIFLNGISIYEGSWHYGQVHGEGYIKSMKCLSYNCPPAFSEASYCGNLASNRLHGIGTIFLNPREKIVTKFANGVPTGELTYYNLRDIQFGVWPCE